MRRVARHVNLLLERRLGVVVSPPGVRPGREWVQRFLYFDRLLGAVADIEGDVAECGVAGGSSLAMLASIVRDRGIPRHVFGFDSWSGLPEPHAADRGPTSVAAAGLFGWADTDLVRRVLHAHDFGDDDIERTVTLVAGPFVETLPRFDRPLALVHIDADLYESYRVALEHLWPNVVAGGVVALDEYELGALWPGPRRAVDEFMRKKGGQAVLERDERIGKYFIRRAR